MDAFGLTPTDDDSKYDRPLSHKLLAQVHRMANDPMHPDRCPPLDHRARRRLIDELFEQYRSTVVRGHSWGGALIAREGIPTTGRRRHMSWTDDEEGSQYRPRE